MEVPLEGRWDNYTEADCFGIRDVDARVDCLGQHLNISDPPSIYGGSLFDQLWLGTSCLLWNASYSNRVVLQDSDFTECTVPLSGQDALLFVCLAMLCMACLFNKLSAVWVLLAGATLGVANAATDLGHLRNSVALWLSVQPPKLFFYVFLPPLLVDGAMRLDFFMFRKMLAHVLFAAFAMVLASALLLPPFILYGLGFARKGWSWVHGALFASMVASTDAVASTSVLRKGGGPERLTMLLEGEAMLNDAMGLTLFEIFVGLAASTGVGAKAPGVLEVLPEILYNTFKLSTVGAALGVAAGLLARAGLRALRWRGAGSHVEAVVVLAVSYLAYYVSEAIGGSGVVAAAAFGLYGSATRRWGSLARAEAGGGALAAWDAVSFAANGIVFAWSGVAAANDLVRSAPLLKGDAFLVVAAVPVLWLASMALRAGMLFAANPLFARSPGGRLSRADVLFSTWSGLRGAVSLIMVAEYAGLARAGRGARAGEDESPHSRSAAEVAVPVWTAGFVLMTLLINAPTIGTLMHALRLDWLPPERLATRARARRALLRFTQDALDTLRREGGEFLAGANWRAVAEYVDVRRDLNAFRTPSARERKKLKERRRARRKSRWARLKHSVLEAFRWRDPDESLEGDVGVRSTPGSIGGLLAAGRNGARGAAAGGNAGAVAAPQGSFSRARSGAASYRGDDADEYEDDGTASQSARRSQSSALAGARSQSYSVGRPSGGFGGRRKRTVTWTPGRGQGGEREGHRPAGAERRRRSGSPDGAGSGADADLSQPLLSGARGADGPRRRPAERGAGAAGGGSASSGGGLLTPLGSGVLPSPFGSGAFGDLGGSQALGSQALPTPFGSLGGPFAARGTPFAAPAEGAGKGKAGASRAAGGKLPAAAKGPGGGAAASARAGPSRPRSRQQHGSHSSSIASPPHRVVSPQLQSAALVPTSSRGRRGGAAGASGASPPAAPRRAVVGFADDSDLSDEPDEVIHTDDDLSDVDEEGRHADELLRRAKARGVTAGPLAGAGAGREDSGFERARGEGGDAEGAEGEGARRGPQRRDAGATATAAAAAAAAAATASAPLALPGRPGRGAKTAGLPTDVELADSGDLEAGLLGPRKGKARGRGASRSPPESPLSSGSLVFGSDDDDESPTAARSGDGGSSSGAASPPGAGAAGRPRARGRVRAAAARGEAERVEEIPYLDSASKRETPAHSETVSRTGSVTGGSPRSAGGAQGALGVPLSRDGSQLARSSATGGLALSPGAQGVARSPISPGSKPPSGSRSRHGTLSPSPPLGALAGPSPAGTRRRQLKPGAFSAARGKALDAGTTGAESSAGAGAGAASGTTAAPGAVPGAAATTSASSTTAAPAPATAAAPSSSEAPSQLAVSTAAPPRAAPSALTGLPAGPSPDSPAWSGAAAAAAASETTGAAYHSMSALESKALAAAIRRELGARKTARPSRFGASDEAAGGTTTPPSRLPRSTLRPSTLATSARFAAAAKQHAQAAGAASAEAPAAPAEAGSEQPPAPSAVLSQDSLSQASSSSQFASASASASQLSGPHSSSVARPAFSAASVTVAALPGAQPPSPLDSSAPSSALPSRRASISSISGAGPSRATVAATLTVSGAAGRRLKAELARGRAAAVAVREAEDGDASGAPAPLPASPLAPWRRAHLATDLLGRPIRPRSESSTSSSSTESDDEDLRRRRRENLDGTGPADYAEASSLPRFAMTIGAPSGGGRARSSGHPWARDDDGLSSSVGGVSSGPGGMLVGSLGPSRTPFAETLWRHRTQLPGSGVGSLPSGGYGVGRGDRATSLSADARGLPVPGASAGDLSGMRGPSSAGDLPSASVPRGAPQGVRGGLAASLGRAGGPQQAHGLAPGYASTGRLRPAPRAAGVAPSGAAAGRGAGAGDESAAAPSSAGEGHGQRASAPAASPRRPGASRPQSARGVVASGASSSAAAAGGSARGGRMGQSSSSRSLPGSRRGSGLERLPSGAVSPRAARRSTRDGLVVAPANAPFSYSRARVARAARRGPALSREGSRRHGGEGGGGGPADADGEAPSPRWSNDPSSPRESGSASGGDPAMLRELRGRLILGLSRYFHRKWLQGLLSAESLRILEYSCDVAAEHPDAPLSMWATLERDIRGGRLARGVARAAFMLSKAVRRLPWPLKPIARRVLGALRDDLGKRMLVACEVSVEYYLALLWSPQNAWMWDADEGACLAAEVEAEVELAHRFVLDREIEAPNTFGAIQSFRAAMAILRQQLDRIAELRDAGMLDAGERELAARAVDRRMRHLELTGLVWRPPRPKEVLRGLPFLADLPADYFERVVRAGDVTERATGEVFWTATDVVGRSMRERGPGAFVVVSGVVRQVHILPDGSPHEFYQGIGGIVGILTMLTGARLPGRQFAIAEGTVTGKGPALYHLPQSVAVAIRIQAMDGVPAAARLERGLGRLAANFVLQTLEHVVAEDARTHLGALVEAGWLEGDESASSSDDDDDDDDEEEGEERGENAQAKRGNKQAAAGARGPPAGRPRPADAQAPAVQGAPSPAPIRTAPSPFSGSVAAVPGSVSALGPGGDGPGPASLAGAAGEVATASAATVGGPAPPPQSAAAAAAGAGLVAPPAPSTLPQPVSPSSLPGGHRHLGSSARRVRAVLAELAEAAQAGVPTARLVFLPPGKIIHQASHCVLLGGSVLVPGVAAADDDDDEEHGGEGTEGRGEGEEGAAGRHSGDRGDAGILSPTARDLSALSGGEATADGSSLLSSTPPASSRPSPLQRLDSLDARAVAVARAVRLATARSRAERRREEGEEEEEDEEGEGELAQSASDASSLDLSAPLVIPSGTVRLDAPRPLPWMQCPDLSCNREAAQARTDAMLASGEAAGDDALGCAPGATPPLVGGPRGALLLVGRAPGGGVPKDAIARDVHGEGAAAAAAHPGRGFCFDWDE